MATTKANSNKKTRRSNEIPADVAALGFATMANPDPIYYAPAGAGPLSGVVLARHVRVGAGLEGKDKVFYEVLLLNNFVNGSLEVQDEDGVVTSEKQPDAKTGDVVRIDERAALQGLSDFVGRSVAVCIVCRGKEPSRKPGRKAFWSFAVYTRPLTEPERAKAALALTGQGSALPALLP